MRTVRVSDEVWDQIAKRGKFGESVDDVLRRVFGLDAAVENEVSDERQSRAPRFSTGRRRNKATNRMSSHVSNGRLVVDFAAGHRREFTTPEKSDKSGIRRVRDEACAFAEEHGATVSTIGMKRGRLNAIGAMLGFTLLTVNLWDCNIDFTVFLAWTKKALLPSVPDQSVIVMDNATFHKRSDIIEAMEREGHTVEFLPPYSPDLNPIERKWAQAKARRRQRRCTPLELFSSTSSYDKL